MCNRADKTMQKYFDFSRSNRHSPFNYPKLANDKIKKNVKNFNTVDDIISKEDPELKDLLEKMLEIDPKKRISCSKALKHDFFTIKYK